MTNWQLVCVGSEEIQNRNRWTYDNTKILFYLCAEVLVVLVVVAALPTLPPRSAGEGGAIEESRELRSCR